MNQKLSTALAQRIEAAHATATQLSANARNEIDAAIQAAADVGLLIDEAKSTYKSRLHEWLRDNVKALSTEQADIYHGIYKVRNKRQCIEADTRQLKLIGIIGEDHSESSGTSQRATGDRWVKWTSHVVHHFAELEAQRPLESWEEYERKAIALQLEPLVKLYQRAAGVKVVDI